MNDEQLIERLRHMADISFLATVDGDQPCARAMTHYIDPDGFIWYPTLLRSAKVRQITAHPKVVVSFFDPHARLAPVSVYGTAEIITAGERLEKLWNSYDASIRNIVPEGPGSDNFAFIKITPTNIVKNTYRHNRS